MINAIYPTLLNNTALPFYLTGAGICDPEFNVYRETGLVSHQILFTEDGAGILNACGKEITLKKDSLLYLPPSVPHSYHPLHDEWRTCWIVFRGDNLEKIMPRLGFDEIAYSPNALTDEIRTLFGQLLAAANDPLGAERCSLLTYEYVLAARKALFFPPEVDNTPIQRVLEYIDKHFSEDIELAQLISVFGGSKPLSPQYFCHVFKTAAGMRPMEFIARKRIAHAKLLLWNTESSAAEIGQLCGYSDPSYFGAVFRKYEGITPKEYRNKRGTDII